MSRSQTADIIFKEPNSLQCSGHWTLNYLEHTAAQIAAFTKLRSQTLTINGEAVKTLDSAGAWILYKLTQDLEKRDNTVELVNFDKEQQSLLNLIKEQFNKATAPIAKVKNLSFVARLGKTTILGINQLLEFISFIGEIVINILQCLRHPKNIQWKSFLNTIDETGFRALFIVGLLSFLIGIVLAYQMGQQLKIYGANIYIVSFLGVGILQEFGPLITAIIVAGRTSSAFTAQIGTMQVNEEIDALRTLGLSPVTQLTLPKIFGLLVALPLLIIWADIFGLLGGMIVAKRTLNINFYSFITYFPTVIKLSTLMNGLIKAPLFALIIASVGCFQGFKVSANADSVGWQTTKSVVQAIFLIIVADAIFSVLLPWQNV